MPLESGSSDDVVSRNIKRLMNEKKPDGSKKYEQDQAIAIAYSHAGRSRKKAATAGFGPLMQNLIKDVDGGVL